MEVQIEEVQKDAKKGKLVGPVMGRVSSLESFGSVDGPGVRFVVFMQGCNMRCKYCHNVETWNLSGGTMWTAKKLFDHVYRYRRYWGKNGGITVSGGEPLLQTEFVTELFELAKQHGVHTTLDTSGNPFTTEQPFFNQFERLMKVTDLVMLDIKEMNPDRHKQLTGQDNHNILAMAHYLSDAGIKMWIRHVLVPEITDQEEDLKQLSDFIASLKTVERVEVLPYHTMGIVKWKEKNIPYPLDGIKPPTKDEILRAETLLHIQ